MPRRVLVTILGVALFGWACGILWLSSLSPDELPSAAFVFWDKINHVATFAVGGWLAASVIGLVRPTAPAVGRIVVAVVAIAMFGVVDEAVQTLTPGRSGGDVFDWIADVVGAASGAALSLASFSRLERFVGR